MCNEFETNADAAVGGGLAPMVCENGHLWPLYLTSQPCKTGRCGSSVWAKAQDLQICADCKMLYDAADPAQVKQHEQV
jgi:hypothetical protein